MGLHHFSPQALATVPYWRIKTKDQEFRKCFRSLATSVEWVLYTAGWARLASRLMVVSTFNTVGVEHLDRVDKDIWERDLTDSERIVKSNSAISPSNRKVGHCRADRFKGTSKIRFNFAKKHTSVDHLHELSHRRLIAVKLDR